MPRAVLAVALVLLLYALAVIAPLASASGTVLSVSVHLRPLGDGRWAANVSLEGAGVSMSCSGVVGANPYYRETRAVSGTLLVLPLYYIVDSVCPRGAAALSALAAHPPGGVVVLRVEAPSGYLVATPLGWGRGGAGGREPLQVFLRYTLYDGVVVASLAAYQGRVVNGLLLVEPRGGLQGLDPGLLASAVSCVSGALGEWLGPSPAAPRVFVAAPPGEHGLVLPGTGYSLGAVVYVKPSPGSSAAMVHLVAHEAVHGWLGKGPLRGGEGLVEGAAELLSLLALKHCGPVLYNLSLRYEEEASTLNPYRTWLLLHASLRAAGLRACGRDIYLEALHEMYSRAVNDTAWAPGLPELYAATASAAERHGCLNSLEEALGEELLTAAEKPLPALLEPRGETGQTAPAGAHTATTTGALDEGRRLPGGGGEAPPGAAASATPGTREPMTGGHVSPTPPGAAVHGPVATSASSYASPREAPGAGGAAEALAAMAVALAFLLISRVVRGRSESV